MSNIKIQGGILGAQLHLNQNIQNEQNKQSNSQNNLTFIHIQVLVQWDDFSSSIGNLKICNQVLHAIA